MSKLLGGLMFCLGTIMVFYFGYMGIRSLFEPGSESSGFFICLGAGILMVGACIADRDWRKEKKRWRKKRKEKKSWNY